MKKFLLVAVLSVAAAMLAACATVKVEVDDSREGYAIYCNGKKVCDDSKECRVPVPSGDEMYLEAEKDGVVYGEAVIHRGDGGYSTQTLAPRGTAELTAKAVGMPLGIAAGIIQPLEYITTTTEYFPTEVMIPVMPPENGGDQYPWDQPDPSK